MIGRRALLHVLAMATVVALLSGCTIRASTLKALAEASDGRQASGSIRTAPRGYDVLVANRCGGSDRIVEVFMDGRRLGTVDTAKTFRGIAPGRRQFVARGVAGSHYKVYRTNLYMDRDRLWRLC